VNEADALLAQLRTIQTPEVSAWPAMGWWLLLAFVLFMILLLLNFYRRYRARRWQRQARQALTELRQQAGQVPVVDSLSAASKLARRVLLVSKRRTDIAALHGDAWLKELDAVCGQALFSQGYGKLLEHGPYQRAPELSALDLDGLFDAMHELINGAGRRARYQSDEQRETHLVARVSQWWSRRSVSS